MTGRPRRSRWSRPAKASVVPGARDMKETVFQAKVAQYAVMRGALHYHTHNSERSEGGFPDSVIAGTTGILYRELKSDSSSARVSPKQREWILRLESLGVDVDVWYPIDWERGRCKNEIDAVTRRKSTDGGLVLPEVAKTLFMMSDDRPAAGLLWDAGAKGIDRVTWELRGRSFMRMIAGALPSTVEEQIAWIRRHNLGADTSVGAVIEALRADLASAKGEDVE